MKTHDEIKKENDLYNPEEIKEILQAKGYIHSQEKLYRSALSYIQQLEAGLCIGRMGSGQTCWITAKLGAAGQKILPRKKGRLRNGYEKSIGFCDDSVFKSC